MSIPVPEVALVGTCATIYNNTLYTYSALAFQSLPLEKGSKWTQMSMGVAVDGGSCVMATPPDASTPPALYIVGGTAKSTAGGFSGFQRYNFNLDAWETIQPSTPVTQNRVWHNAVYLNESASILVYAGNQDRSYSASSQTFTISTLAPYNVLAYESIAPPAIAPLLMQWSESSAVMIGGGDTNTKVMIFTPATGWTDSGATLAEPLIKNISAVKAVVQDGNDGSKSLYTFDMTVSPNAVNRTVLIDSNGNPLADTKAITKRSPEPESLEESATLFARRGNLTIANWPVYNGSLASTATRTEYSVAKDESGLVVISGGNDDDILCMFDARDNSWVNATEKLTENSAQNVLEGPGPSITTGTSASASSTTSTSTPTPTQTAPTDTSAVGKAETLRILAAVLGSVLGIAVLLLCMLILLRWRRNRRRYIEAGHQRRSSGLEEKDPMDFHDRGMSFSDSPSGFQSHRQQDSHGSFSSMAILMGKVGNGHQRGMGRGDGSNASDASSTFNKKYKTAISNPIPQGAPAPYIGMPRDEKGVSFVLRPPPGPAPSVPPPKPRASAAARRGSTRRSSGWNRYWSGGSAMNILGFGSKRTTGYSDHTDRTSGSQYSESGARTQVSQHSAVVQPLNLGGPPRLSSVATRSPTISTTNNNSDFPLKEGLSGKIERPGSAVSDASSYDDRRDAFSSGVPESVRDENAWTPFGSHGWTSGVPSAAYTESNYDTRTTIADYSRQGPSSNYPPIPDSRKQHEAPTSDMSWLNLGRS